MTPVHDWYWACDRLAGGENVTCDLLTWAHGPYARLELEPDSDQVVMTGADSNLNWSWLRLSLVRSTDWRVVTSPRYLVDDSVE